MDCCNDFNNYSTTVAAITGFVGWRVNVQFTSAKTANIPGGMSMTPVVSFRPPTGNVNMTAGPYGTRFTVRHGTARYQHLGRQGAATTTMQTFNKNQASSASIVRRVFFRWNTVVGVNLNRIKGVPDLECILLYDFCCNKV